MKKESSRLERNHALAKALLDHFQLRPEEIRVLHGSPKNLTIEEGFYATLDKLRRIHDDCKHLVRCKIRTKYTVYRQLLICFIQAVLIKINILG